MANATGLYETPKRRRSLNRVTTGDPRSRHWETNEVTTALDLTTRLENLENDYTYLVNELLEEDREDLASKAAQEYLDKALRLVQKSRS